MDSVIQAEGRWLEFLDDRPMGQLQKTQRRENGRIRLRTPCTWFLMTITRLLAEDQQERGQKDQKKLLMAEMAHVAEIQ